MGGARGRLIRNERHWGVHVFLETERLVLRRFTMLDADLLVDPGYRLHRFAWGQGYATEGSRALIDHGFTALGVRRVVAETMFVHTASRRVMEKCGLRLVRTFHADWPVHIPGDEHGDVEYAITRDEWETARRAT